MKSAYVIPDDGLIDEIAIARRMAGDKKVRLSHAERVELVRRWRAAGRSLHDCDHVAGLNSRRYLTGGAADDQRS